MSTPYPKRDNFYALRMLRALSCSMDAPDLGPTACWLLAIVATREDQLRYEQAPQFYNQHLMTTMGMSCAKQLDRARDKAEAKGWLHYERNHNRAMARYWTKIPAAEQERGQLLQADNQGSTAANVSTISPESVPNVSRECPDSFPNSVPNTSQPSVALLPVAPALGKLLATEQQGAVAPAAGAADLFRGTTEKVATEPAKPKAPRTRQQFTPPTMEELGAYAAEIGMAPADAAKFWDYQMAKGWKVGREPMKDWRAALRYWKGNGFNAPAAGSAPAYLQLPTPEERAASRAREPIVYTPEELDNQAFIKKMTDEHEARQAAKAAAKANQEPTP